MPEKNQGGEEAGQDYLSTFYLLRKIYLNIKPFNEIYLPTRVGVTANKSCYIFDADSTTYFDSQSQRWIRVEINFSESNIERFEGIMLPVMPKQDLITYKQWLDRKVDRIDIKEMQHHIT